MERADPIDRDSGQTAAHPQVHAHARVACKRRPAVGGPRPAALEPGLSFLHLGAFSGTRLSRLGTAALQRALRMQAIAVKRRWRRHYTAVRYASGSGRVALLVMGS